MKKGSDLRRSAMTSDLNFDMCSLKSDGGFLKMKAVPQIIHNWSILILKRMVSGSLHFKNPPENWKQPLGTSPTKINATAVIFL